MKEVIKYLAGSWRAWLASGMFVAGAELWHREELRVNGLRAGRMAEEITRNASEGKRG